MTNVNTANKKLFILVLPVLIVQCFLVYLLVMKFYLFPEGKTRISKSPASGGSPENTYVIQGIVTNPAGTSGTRSLEATVALEYEESNVGKELRKRDIHIRDALINIFLSKKVEDLDDVEDKNKLRIEILNQLNQELTSGKLKEVYFTNFVMR